MSPKHRRPICSIVHVQIHPCSQSMKTLLSQSQTQGNLTVLNAPQSWHCLRTWSIGLTPTPTCGSAEANVRSQLGSSWNPPATSPAAAAQQSCITWREDWRLAIPGRSAQPTTVDRHEKTINRGFLEELPHTQRETGGHKLVFGCVWGIKKGFTSWDPVTAIKISHPNLIHCGQYDFSCYVQVQDGTSTIVKYPRWYEDLKQLCPWPWLTHADTRTCQGVPNGRRLPQGPYLETCQGCHLMKEMPLAVGPLKESRLG